MQSDVIHVSNGGAGFEAALEQTEKVAAYLGLEHMDTLHLRLFGEETMGMMRALTGEQEADFWLEANNKCVRLHLRAKTVMNAEKRKKLLDVSTSGENAAVKGVMGRIRDVFQRALEQMDEMGVESPIPGAVLGDISGASVNIWTLTQYKNAIRTEPEEAEAWDELERSVISKLADEVQISIHSKLVEMIISKQF